MIRIKIVKWERPSTKIIITVFSALFVVSGYFIAYNYNSYLSEAENQTLQRLAAISNTLAPHIDGDGHQRICEKYKTRGLLTSNAQDTDYFKINKVLAEAYTKNKLETEIATLVYVRDSNIFHYIVNSLDSPYVRDPYRDFLPEFMDALKHDTVIHQYKDEFGSYLTALSPIKNSKGENVAILEVDMQFDVFISEARRGLYKNIAFSVLIFVLTVVVLLRYLRVILVAEEESRQKIEESAMVIAQKNKDILDSINYARKIQNAILPPKEEVFSVFSNAFILYKPKDIVSGDFYFFMKSDNRVLIAAADCTGHGVPGALMSMIGNDLLHQIIREMKMESPSDILDNLHKGVTNILKQDLQRDSKDGMDIALLSFDYDFTNLMYAGAYRPMYLVRDKKLIEYKANKFPIGNAQQDRDKFKNNDLTLQEGDMCYIFTDGYADQFGGQKGKKFMVKNFQQLLLDISSLPISEQEKILSETIEYWRGVHEQVDDILVIGIRI